MEVFVTGAASGIGKATTEKLIEKGQDIIAFDIDSEGLEELPDEIETFHGDVYDEERVKEVVEEIEFDVLVNCAGYYELGAIEDMSSRRVEKHFRANVFGPLNFIRHSLPMLKQRNGRIVNISSVAGRLSLPFFGSYCGTKHALESISDSLAMELEDTGVEVVIVEPGPVNTGFNQSAREKLNGYLPDTDYGEKYEKILESSEGDSITPEKAAETVVEAVLTEDPKRRYTTGLRSKAVLLLSKLLPRSIKEKVVKKSLGY